MPELCKHVKTIFLEVQKGIDKAASLKLIAKKN
jgi:hypothetical protein